MQVDKERRKTVVLVVENNAHLQELIRCVLELDGYVLLSAADGEEAQQICRRYLGPIDLLLTDIDLPGTNGCELAPKLCNQRPDLKVLYMSASGFDSRGSRAQRQKDTLFLQKPFLQVELIAKIRQALSA